jgi:hypothetical protein
LDFAVRRAGTLARFAIGLRPAGGFWILDWLRNHRTELDIRQNFLMIPLIGPERPELLCEDEELETLFFGQ